MTTITINTDSPECAWPPFMDWLQAQGIDPAETRTVDIDTDTMRMTATLYVRNSDGNRFVIYGTDEVATQDATVPVDSLPPRRTA